MQTPQQPHCIEFTAFIKPGFPNESPASWETQSRMLFLHWSLPSSSVSRKEEEGSLQSSSPGNHHTARNFSAPGKIKVTIHTLSCPLGCWETLCLRAVMVPRWSDPACQSTTPTYNSSQHRFSWCTFRQWCLDSGVLRSYQDPQEFSS